jgi:hypothetical protein
MFVHVPSQDQDYQHHMLWSVFLCSNSWGGSDSLFCWYWLNCRPSLFKLSFPTFFIGSRLKIHVHHYPSAWITGLSIFSNVPVLHYLQVVLCIKIWTFSWIPYKTRTKYQLKWVKVPGTTPYWKACYHNLLKKVKGQRNGHAI